MNRKRVDRYLADWGVVQRCTAENKCFYGHHLVAVGLTTPIWALPPELLQFLWFNRFPDWEGTHSHLSVSVPGSLLPPGYFIVVYRGIWLEILWKIWYIGN